MVLLYSVRFRRLAVTRPGSAFATVAAGAAFAAFAAAPLEPACSDSTQAVTAATSSADGCGEVRGGMVPAFNLSSTFVQTSGFCSTSEESWKASRLKPAVWIR